MIGESSGVAEHQRRFLVVGERQDLDVAEKLPFDESWEAELRAKLAREGTPHGPTGIDYFAFPRGLWGELPPFAIGRTTWDNWLLYRARARRAVLIDASRMITAIHQNHDYAHAPGGEEEVWKGREAQRNRQLAGGNGQRIFTLADATLLLTRDGLKSARRPEHWARARQTWLVLHPGLRKPRLLADRLAAFVRRIPRIPGALVRRSKRLWARLASAK